MNVRVLYAADMPDTALAGSLGVASDVTEEDSPATDAVTDTSAAEGGNKPTSPQALENDSSAAAVAPSHGDARGSSEPPR